MLPEIVGVLEHASAWDAVAVGVALAAVLVQTMRMTGPRPRRLRVMRPGGPEDAAPDGELADTARACAARISARLGHAG